MNPIARGDPTHRGRQILGDMLFSQLRGGLWRLRLYKRSGGMLATAELSCPRYLRVIELRV